MASQLLLEKALLSRQGKTDNQHIFRWHPWLLASLLLLLGFAVVVYSATDGQVDRVSYWQWQQPLFIALNQGLQQLLPALVWENLTEAGDALILLPLLALISLHQRQVWLALIATVPFAGGASVILKKLVAMPRPGAVMEPEGWTAIGSILTGHNSLPSGHALCAFAAVSAFLLARYPQGKWQATVIGIAAASLIALSRVAVAAHWPLDIVAGAGLGILAGLCSAFLVQRCAWQPPVDTKGRLMAMLVLQSFAAALVGQIVETQNPVLVLWLALFACLLCCVHLLLEGMLSIKITVLRHRSL